MWPWADIRRQARQVVHSTFADSNVRYYATLGVGAGSLISARTINRIVAAGDLNNDGYAQQIVEVEKIILLRADVDAYDIKRGGVVGTSDGRLYKLEARVPPRDDFTVDFHVVRVG